MTAPVHFYLTFNPFLNTDLEPEYTQAHQFYDLLKSIIEKDKNGTAYWGKIIGEGRESVLDLEVFKNIVETNSEENQSTHLYITDFKNLWVGKVKSVRDEKPKKGQAHSFYEGKNVEVWFEISDFALLEYAAEETANKMSEFYIDNDFMDLKIDEMSPFTTGIKYPAFIQDLAEEMVFDEMDTDEYDHLCLKPNPATVSNASGQVLKCLHTFSFPEQIYTKLPHAAKMEIEMAELDMLEQRHHNLTSIAFSYIKALEIIINDLVIHHLKRKGFGKDFYVDNSSMPPKLYHQEERSGLITISKFQKNYSINQLIYFVEKCDRQSHLSFKKAFSQHKGFVKFLTGEFRQILRDNQLIQIRGILAHNDSASVTPQDAYAIRNLILGVGHKGLINMLYQSFYPEKYKPLVSIQKNYENPGESTNNSNKAASKLKLVG